MAANCTLGFAGGPAVAFRIDPESIDWDWQILTNVTETVGGRVIQVLGAYLNDLTVTGSLGQDHSTPRGESWRQAEAFLTLVSRMMSYQSQNVNRQSDMGPPAVFTYLPKNWRFSVYIKSLSDADGGGSVVLAPGKFNQRYVLKLFIVQDASEGLTVAGTSSGVLNAQKASAIAAYFARISEGIGWHISQYNGPVGASSGIAPKKPAKTR